jgi:hypothetical protein
MTTKKKVQPRPKKNAPPKRRSRPMSYEDETPANPPEQPEQQESEEEQPEAPVAAANPTPNEIVAATVTPTPPRPAAPNATLTPNQIIAALTQR